MGLLEQLANNLRLRLGIAAIVVIALAYGLLEWRDHLATATADYRSVLNQVARLSQPQNPALWRQRAGEATEALRDARQGLWRNTSPGLAQAQVQDWLGRLLRQTDAKGVTLRVAEPDTTAAPSLSATPTNAASPDRMAGLPPELRKLQPVRARVELNSDPAVMLALLAALNDAEHRVGVDTLNIKPGKSELSLTFWFEIAPQPGTTPKASQ